MPDTTVIVPTYNGEKTLARCINSVLSSDGDIEVLIVDDGSTDGTLRVARELRRIDGRVRVISQSNMGVSAARNTGLEQARSKYVMFIDSDDWLEPRAVNHLSRFIEESGVDVVIAGIFYDYERNGGELVRRLKSTPVPMSIRDGFQINDSNVTDQLVTLLGFSSNKIYDRAWLFEEDIRYNNSMRLFEDLDFNKRALLSARSVLVVDSAYIHYTIGSVASLSHARPNNFLTLRCDANRNIDAILEKWQASEGVRSALQAELAALSLWAALNASSWSSKPAEQFREMLAKSGGRELVEQAISMPSRGFRSKWIAYTVCKNRIALALLPLRFIRRIEKVFLPDLKSKRRHG